MSQLREVKHSENVVLIGAGSASFTRGLVRDMVERRWEGEIRLVDIDPTALQVAKGLAEKMTADSGLSVRASRDRKELLPGADIVICTISVGGRRAWEQDLFIPRKHGIFQPVGDSVMPGGASRALRMVPGMIEIARDVVDLAPDALFFNYGNPMGPVCRGIRKAVGAPVTGLCHGVIHVARYLQEILCPDARDFAYIAAGINHLTWFTDVSAGGTNLSTKLKAEAAKRTDTVRTLKAGIAEGGDPGELHRAEPNPFSWELCDLIGAFPAVLDRHVMEFYPGLFTRENSYFGLTPGVDAFSFERTIESGDAGFKEMRKVAESPGPLPVDYFKAMGGEHEQVVAIVESIRGNDGRVYSANLPNRGQVPNLPENAVVEGPCRAGAGGLEPVAVPPLPDAAAAPVEASLCWVELVVDAALNCDRDALVQALFVEGAVGDISACAALADDLLKAQSPYLPDEWGL